MSLAAAYGLTPSGVDALSLREWAVLVLGAEERKRDTVTAVGLVLDGLYNYSWRSMQGGQGVAFGHHARAMLGITTGGLDAETIERVRAKTAAHRAERVALGLEPGQA